MNNFQRFVNLLAIAGVLYYLHSLSVQVNQKYGDYAAYNDIVQTIGKNDTLSQNMLQTIQTYSQNESPYNLQNTPLCLFKAYYSIIIKQKIDAKGLFYLFQLSQHQYDNIDSCLNYYSILLVRAQSLQDQVRPKITQILQRLQKVEIHRKYETQKNSQNICIYFSTFNNQKSIKSQLTVLASQNYEKYSVQMQDRGSTDNTVIISTYMLQQLYNNTQAKIFINSNKEKKEAISGLLQFTKQCKQNSIILVIGENQTLVGSNALELVNRVFAIENLDVAVFSSLSQVHLNLQYPHSYEELSKLASPIIAFRKQAFQESDKLLKIQDQPTLSPFWRNLLSQYLVSLKGKRSLKIINQGVVLSKSSKKNLQVADIQMLYSKYKQIFATSK